MPYAIAGVITHTDLAMSHSIEFNIAKVRQLIREAEKKYGRSPGSVRLIAASKAHPASLIRDVAAAGVRDVGENYLQEALAKQAQLLDLPLIWHFIGPIQSNKTRTIAQHFDWVHSVDRLKIAQRLSDQRPSGLPPLNICLQVNISGEVTKSGMPPDQVVEVAAAVSRLHGIAFRGLMAIPGPAPDFTRQRESFHQLAKIANRLRSEHPHLDTLSMGMSGDMEAAIAEGATMVRIGTRIFGPRSA